MRTTELTRVRRFDERKADDFVQRAAMVARRTARTDRALAHALGVDRSRAVRYRNGSCPHSPFANAIALHYRLAASDAAKAWDLIAEEFVVVTQAEIERASVVELEARLAQLKDVEHTVHQFTVAMRAASGQEEEDHALEAQNDVAEIAWILERAAIRRRLAELKEKHRNGRG